MKTRQTVLGRTTCLLSTVCLAILTSCSTPKSLAPSYLVQKGVAASGEAVSSGDYATIFHSNRGKIHMQLIAIDGVEPPHDSFGFFGTRWDWSCRVFVPPGKHELVFNNINYQGMAELIAGGVWTYGKKKTLHATLEAGNSYEIKAVLGNDPSEPIVVTIEKM